MTFKIHVACCTVAQVNDVIYEPLFLKNSDATKL